MARKNFHHPFQPYDIQQQFMEAVYDCIEDGKVGIFESPTGTGKSLSLICGSLTWLREHKRKTFDDSLAAIQVDDDEPQWMVEHSAEAARQEARQMRTDFEARLDAVRQRERKIRDRSADGEPPSKRRKQMGDDMPRNDVGEDQFVLENYESDDERQPRESGGTSYSSETTKLMDKLGMLKQVYNDQNAEEEQDELKIFFCSRTHSQLSQLVGELKRVKLPPGLPPEQDEKTAVEELKQLTLGSRKNLCINAKVAKLAHQTAINERCMEFQQPNTPADQKCPHLPNKENQDLVLDFRDHALARIRDIEDLAMTGHRLKICPYYASRTAIGPAEIVTLPYPLLLQKSARAALGISLKGHVIIIDEAHNLMNALEGICSSQITETQLSRSRESLMFYLQRFRNRLKGSNRVYVTQVIRVIDSLLLSISTFKATHEIGGELNSDVLLSGKGVDQVNLSKLVQYISNSKLARKVEGYATFMKDIGPENGKMSKVTDIPALTHVQNFLMTLVNPSNEGRFFWSKDAEGIILRYLLLDPSEHFRDIVEEARAVILAGGTMSPMEDYKQQLFPYVATIRTLSCGHLIPTSNLLVRTIASDHDGPLDFSFKARSDTSSAFRVGQVLLGLAPAVKGGLVVFFPSYGHLDLVITGWRKHSIMDELHKLKPIFTDGRNVSAEDTFKAYSEAVESNPHGAILLSVIGGKLSEGINFSDELGRCVVVVGLPFPNLNTPEWQAKMKYLDQKATTAGTSISKAGREHAENVCMRSVNQAIGRVIRHKDDWASILLMDSRYAQDRIKGKLPMWIRECLPSVGSVVFPLVNDVVRDVQGFFQTKAT